MLQSILHAAHLRFVLSYPIPTSTSALTDKLSTSHSLPHLLRETKLWVKENFPAFKMGLEEAGWKTDEIGFADHGRRVTWRNSDD